MCLGHFISIFLLALNFILRNRVNPLIPPKDWTRYCFLSVPESSGFWFLNGSMLRYLSWSNFVWFLKRAAQVAQDCFCLSLRNGSLELLKVLPPVYCIFLKDLNKTHFFAFLSNKYLTPILKRTILSNRKKGESSLLFPTEKQESSYWKEVCK